MKILFILDEFLPENSGGAANVAFRLAKGLIATGNELLVVTATHDPEKVEKLKIDNVQIEIIFSKQFGRFRNWKNLKNRGILCQSAGIFKDFKPDVVHIHTLHHRFSYGIIGLAKKFAKAVFLTLHDSQIIYNGKLYPKRRICNLNPATNYKITRFDRLKRDGLAFNPFQGFFIKKALKKIDKIFAVSNALKSALEVNGVSNIEVTHNGINTDEWVDGEANGNNILFAGRVGEAKGIKVLTNAFGKIKSEISDAKLLIVGDGSSRTSDNKNIRILPWQSGESMKKIFSEVAVVIVPSLYLDPFPTVNLEAMAAGKPVVGTCFGGTPEAVVDNKTGYIVNPYNEKEMAEKIIDLLKNPEKAARFGNNGRERVKNVFSLKKQVQKTLEWYKKFIEK